MLGKGDILASGSENDLASQMQSTARTIVAVKAKEGSSSDEVAKTLRAMDTVTTVTVDGEEEGATVFEVLSEGELRAELCRVLVGEGHDILQLARNHRELENIFLKLVKDGGKRRASN